MKTLIVIAHPTIEKSRVNRRWIKELERYPNEFTIHHLDSIYPTGNIDIQKEQQLIEAHDQLILQFPIYWFNCPPLMKQWLDEVFTYGWAYGPSGKNLVGRKIGLAVTAGISEKDYTVSGRYHYPLAQVLLPFEMTFNYVQANYVGFVAFYSAEFEAFEERIEDSVADYLAFLRDM